MGSDNRSDLKLLAVILMAAAVLLAAIVVLVLPAGEEFVLTLSDGVGLKSGLLWGFATTVTLFIVFALVAGDSLLGELQFMLGSFFLFFFVLSLLIAWVF